MLGRMDRVSRRSCVNPTVFKLSLRLGEEGRPGPEIGDMTVLGGGGIASATSLYETMAREDRVVAGRLPGKRKENGKPCRLPPL